MTDVETFENLLDNVLAHGQFLVGIGVDSAPDAYGPSPGAVSCLGRP